MPVYYQTPQRTTRGYATFRDAVDDFKRKEAERLALQQGGPEAAYGIPDEAYDEYGDQDFYIEEGEAAPEWLAKHAMPPMREADDQGIPFEPPPMMSPEEAAQTMREHDQNYGEPVGVTRVPDEYLMPERSLREHAGRYGLETVDALGRGITKGFAGDFGDRFAAGMQTLTGWGGGIQGDYRGNLQRERARGELAGLNSPVASAIGKFGGNVLQGAADTMIGLKVPKVIRHVVNALPARHPRLR